MTNIYISGKITGLSRQEIRKNFDLAITQVTLKYGRVGIVDPSTMPVFSDNWSDFMIADLMALKCCDAIALQPNWKESKGCNVERAFAEGMGIEIIEL